MRAFIDPTTGKLREPTPDDLVAAPVIPKTDVKPLKQIAGPNGTIGIVLDDSFMVHSVATVNPDGTISIDCVNGKENAEKSLTGAPRPKMPAGQGFRDEK
jgi:hypothetical protein